MSGFNRKTIVLAGCLVMAAQLRGLGADIKVGVYEPSSGSKGIYEALQNEPGVKARMMKKMPPKTDTLFYYDVLILGSLKGMAPADIQALRTYANVGGGILLNHDACGYNGNEALFPEVCKGLRTTKTASLVPVKELQHAVTKDLPSEYTHAYSDHVVLECGPKGLVIVNDKDGTPAVVVGEVGHGRVVANGAMTGYWSDVGVQTEGEGAPKGGELQALVSAVKWLGEKPITGLAKNELGRRKKETKETTNETVAEVVSAKAATSSDADWFGDEMLRGIYWIRPPVNELGGKFFLFCDQRFVLSNMDHNRLGVFLRQLKWMGVTDIIYMCDLQDAINRPSDIPKEILGGVPVKGGRDVLMEVMDLAGDAGLDVWAGWHLAKVPDHMASHDQNGKPYLYGGKFGGAMADLLSPEYRQLCHALLGEYVAKYNKRGNFKGLYYDEIFFSCTDFHVGDLKQLNAFCRERFGEGIPKDMVARLAKQTGWADPSDKWWRRYILFKNWVSEDFLKDLTETCHQKGLQMMIELRPTAVFPTGWNWGMDNEAFTRLGADYYFVASGDYCEPCFVYPNALVGGHVCDTWGYYDALSFRGHKASVHFADNQFWRLLVFGNNPKGGPQVEHLIRNTREWADGQNLATVAILYNQNALQMILGKESSKAVSAESALLDRLSHYQDVDMILAGAVEYFKNYKVLLAPPYSLRGMSPERYKALREYVEKGGTLITMSECTVSRADLTQETDRTAELTGGKNKGETMRKQLGAGQVIAIPVDVMREIMQANKETENRLCRLVAEASKPAITVSGELKAMTSVKKGNWVAVSLLSEKIPGKGIVKFDMPALGIPNTTFRVIMLGKEMEIARPGDFWGNKGGWTVEDLRSGVSVTIVKDNDEKLVLPAKFNDSEYVKADANYINVLTREPWNAIGAKKRHYEYEIVVIAPADEIKGRP